MVKDLKVHQGSKVKQDEFAEAMLYLTQGWKEQGFTDDYILAFLELWSKIYSSQGTETVVGYVEV